VFGRASKPRSHRLYVASGATLEKFSDPLRLAPDYTGDEKACLLELRSDTAAGGAAQTVFPPSLHEDTGELIKWCGDSIEPRVISAFALRQACAWLAVGCLIMRYVEPDIIDARKPTLHMAGALWSTYPSPLSRAAYRWLGRYDPDGEPRRHIPDDVDLPALVAMIRNDFDREGWVRVGLAIHAASGGGEAGHAAWVEFSRRSPRHHNMRTVDRVWRSFNRSPPREVGLGTLRYLAQEAQS
jgi:hypothetical protein